MKAIENEYEYYKKYRVNATSVSDFLKRYTNYNTISQAIAAHEVRVRSYQKEVDKYGFCYMTKFMSITGQPVTYYPESEDLK